MPLNIDHVRFTICDREVPLANAATWLFIKIKNRGVEEGQREQDNILQFSLIHFFLSVLCYLNY